MILIIWVPSQPSERSNPHPGGPQPSVFQTTLLGYGPWLFGNLQPIRDVDDWYSTWLTSGYFLLRLLRPGSRIRRTDIYGYGSSLEAIERMGVWEEVSGAKGGWCDCWIGRLGRRGFVDLKAVWVVDYFGLGGFVSRWVGWCL